MEIRKSTPTEKTQIIKVHQQAFGNDQGDEIGQLVQDLFEDETALPILSLIALNGNNIVGHILFTTVKVAGASKGIKAQILAPLAVLPEAQGNCVGTLLIKKGLVELKKSGVSLVFVLGHPEYYSRLGFTPAGILGFEAPHPIPSEHSECMDGTRIVFKCYRK